MALHWVIFIWSNELVNSLLHVTCIISAASIQQKTRAPYDARVERINSGLLVRPQDCQAGPAGYCWSFTEGLVSPLQLSVEVSCRAACHSATASDPVTLIRCQPIHGKFLATRTMMLVSYHFMIILAQLSYLLIFDSFFCYYWPWSDRWRQPDFSKDRAALHFKDHTFSIFFEAFGV